MNISYMSQGWRALELMSICWGVDVNFFFFWGGGDIYVPGMEGFGVDVNMKGGGDGGGFEYMSQGM